MMFAILRSLNINHPLLSFPFPSFPLLSFFSSSLAFKGQAVELIYPAHALSGIRMVSLRLVPGFLG